MRVVFPHPELPVSTTSSPRSTENRTFFNAAGYHLGGCALHEAYRGLLARGGLTVYGCNDELRSLGLPTLARWAEG